MLIKELKNYYRREQILSTEFNCKYKKECRGACESFTEARAAYIGKRYGEGAPRLLFISSDPGSNTVKKSSVDFSAPEKRTPESVQEGVIRRYAEYKNDKVKPSPRFKSTNELAFCILRAFNSKIAEEDVLQYYAHINAAKCCMNNKGRQEAGGKLFKNCRGYLRGEMEIFSPQILITHSGKAKNGAQYALRGEKITAEKDGVCICELQNGKSFFWLHTPHPSSWGRQQFLKQKNGEDGGPGWGGYVEKMRQFIAAAGGKR